MARSLLQPSVVAFLLTCAAAFRTDSLSAAQTVSAESNASATSTESPGSDDQLLTDPKTAAALGLTPEQQAQIQSIITERDTALGSAEESARAAIRREAGQKLLAVLNPDQQRLFDSLFHGKTLRFNFRYQKWADVLDWVSKEADLSLVMDTPPPGTFHYSDSRDYTTAEAIDLLNGWLLTKGFTLVRRERMLMCLDLKGGLPEGAIPRVEIAELPIRGRFDVVSVLFPLEGRPAEAVLTEVKPLLGTYGKAEPLAQTQQLLVTDTASNLRIVEQTIQKVPIPPKPAPPQPKPEPPKPVLEIYPIQHANPTQAGEVLKQILSGTVVVDEKARQISINAIPDEQAKAKTIISQLESNQGSGGVPTLQLYAMQMTDAEPLMATLRLVAPTAQIRMDPATEQLVVWGTAEDQQRISESLRKLETTQTNSGGRQLQVYTLQVLEPTAISTLLQTLLPSMKITVDSGSRSLIAVGTLADHEAIRNMIDQLESEATAEGKSRRLVIYAADDIDASSVSALLKTLVPEANITIDGTGQRLLTVASEQDHQRVTDVLEQVRGDEATAETELRSYTLKPDVTITSITSLLTSLVPRAGVTADEAKRRLLISATAKDHRRIEQIISQVETAGVGELPELRFYPLQKAGGPTTVTILSAIAPSAKISFEESARRLSVVATAADHAAIDATVRKLEAASPEKQQRILKLYDVTATRKTRFQAIAAGLASELPGMQVIVDAQPDELAIWASADQHEVVSEVLAQLDREIPADQQRQLIVYPIRQVDPAGVAEILTSLFPDAQITTDLKTGRLMIHARPAVHQSIRSAIEQIDTDVPAEKEIKLMVYPVHGINPTTAQNLIASELPEVTVIPDTTAETLIVRGRLDQQQRVAELLDSLRGAAAGLQNRRAVAYPAMFSDQIRTTEFFAAAFPRTRVVLDAASRRMTVWATDSEHQQISEAVAEMSGMADDKSLQVFELGNVSSTIAVQVLTAALPDVSFLQPPTGTSVMAWLDETQTVQARDILQKLRDSESLGTERTLQFYSIRDLGSSVTAVLSQAVPTARINPGASSDQLAIVASAADHQRIAELLQQLNERKQLPAERTLAVYPITGADPTALQQVLRPLLDADVQLTVDNTGRKLFIRAAAEKQQKIREIIDQVTSTLNAGEGRTTKTYLIGAPNADEAQEVLKAMYPDATIVTDSDRKLIVATALPEQHQMIEEVASQMRGTSLDAERPKPAIYTLKNADTSEVQSLLQSMYSRFDGVRFSVNDSAGQLVVVARPEQQTAIAELISQLDNNPASPTKQELAVFRLNGIDGRAAQEAIQPLLPKSAQATVDRAGGQLFVSAPEDQMPAVRELVEKVFSASGSRAGLITRSYRMMPYEADEAQEVLKALFPDATLVTDSGDEVLVATATAEQHDTIRTVVSEMTNRGSAESSGPTVEAYPLSVADGASAVTALQGLFGRRDDVRVSFDAKSRTLVAVARPRQHDTIRALVEQLERTDEATGPRTVEIYSLKNVDSSSAVNMAEGILQSIDPAASVSYERRSGQLIVTTIRAGHEKMLEAVEQLTKRDPREVDVIQLQFLSATSAQMSIEGLYSDDAFDDEDIPTIQADDDSQQLLIRGTGPQLREIRTLLTRMGEPGLAAAPGSAAISRRRLRVIPVHGDTDAALRRIQDLWPRIRNNPIRVLTPGQQPVPESSAPEPSGELPADAPQQSSGQYSIPAENFLYEPAVPDEPDSVQQPIDSIQQTEPKTNPAPEEVPPAAQTALDDRMSDGEPARTTVEDPPPVTIISGDGRITLISEDLDALDQLESLLKAAFSQPGGGRNRDFAIYQLRNAGADDVARTLKSVYESPAGLLSFGSVVLVPEPRMNALIVYGGRTDRERIEQLLEVLDTEKLPDSARAFRTQVVEVRFTSAQQIDSVLRGVYRAEMAAGGSRRNIEIPTGIPAEVASVLRQINAAASSPLLTVEVQRDTNSLVLKAPQNLLEEVTQLISDLDETAATNRSRRVTLLPLKSTNSTRVMKILGDILD